MIGLGGPEYEDCPPGYVDNGVTCVKQMKVGKQKFVKGAFGEDLPAGFEIEPMDIRQKKVKGSGHRRQGGAYAQFVKEFAQRSPGPDLMRRAADAWKNR